MKALEEAQHSKNFIRVDFDELEELWKKLVFLPKAFSEMSYWAETDRNILVRIFELIKDVRRNTFSGIGKPEPLKHQLKGFWSRRITQEHRPIYKVSGEELIIVSCRFHYSK